ncbi:MAG: cupin domain-containing protein [Fibrobacterota bacterium]
MKNSIPTAVVNPAQSLAQNRCSRLPVLPGEIADVRTFAGAQAPSTEQIFHPVADRLSIFFFIRGTGSVVAEEKTFTASPWALFIPAFRAPFSFTCAPDVPLEYLEIELAVTPEDAKDLEATKKLLPYFIRYADCRTYREAIKSEKTVNRTLVPEKIIPRFCMGSVETAGPDAVGAHRHPMLEQLFFGLKDNLCDVTADAKAVSFGEFVLLHVPSGSEHGVRVNTGCKLHYLWLDFFKDREGVEWIAKMHKPNDA